MREEVVLIRSHYHITLLSPGTRKIAKVTVENYDFDFDIARGCLICLSPATDGTVRLLVAKLSRIFEQIQGTPLEDICEICRVLTFIQPTSLSRYTLTVCDPMGWGSVRPCRILLAHISYRISNSENKRVQVHRLYLEGSHNGSDLALTYNSSSNCVPLEKSSDRQLALTQPSIPGRWMLPCRPGKGKYDIMIDRLWEDDVRLSPSDDVSYVRVEADRFSGTQIWYLEDGNCILHFFDELCNI